MKPVIKFLILAAMLGVLANATALADTAAKPAPSNGMINVAVVLGENIQVIAFAGPWEVFQDTTLKGSDGKTTVPYELYTVAASTQQIHTTGSNHPGMTITPDYTFTDAPTPDIVVLTSQAPGSGLIAWLKKLHGEHKTIMSVGAGAFTLAHAGLLGGKAATAHHFDYEKLAHEFPDIHLVKQVRYVQADPTTFTAAGMTSGIDLALHLVAKRFGPKVAERTADYMEYMGAAWKTNKAKAFPPAPLKRSELSGELPSGALVVQHIVSRGGSIESFTTDIPAWNVVAAPTKMKHDGDKLIFIFPINGQTATFTGRFRSAAGGSGISGTLVLHDGKSYPLTMRAH